MLTRSPSLDDGALASLEAQDSYAIPALVWDVTSGRCKPNIPACSWLKEVHGWSSSDSGDPAADLHPETLFESGPGMPSFVDLVRETCEAREIRRGIFGMKGTNARCDVQILPMRVMDDAARVMILPTPLSAPAGEATALETDLNLLLEERTAEITELNRFLEAIVDSSTETFIIAVSRSGYLLSFNAGARQLFGYAANDIVGRMHASELISAAEDRRTLWDGMEARARREGKSREMVRLQRNDGSVFPALVDLTPLLNAEHQALGTLFVGRDMTEALETQRALEERTEQLEFLNTLSLEIGRTLELESIARLALGRLISKFDASDGAFFVKNAETSDLKLLVTVPGSPRAMRMDQLTPSIEDAMLVEDGEVLVRELHPHGDDDAAPSYRLMLPLLPKASFLGVFVLLQRAQPQRNDELMRFLSAIGTTIGAAIENAILYEESLAKSVEIRKQNKELDEFAYVVSHDLKEPLAGISFISNLITDEYYDKMDDTGKTYISSLIDFSKRLGSLIDALLDLSRIGRITSPPVPVDIGEVMHDVQQNLLYRISSRNIQLHVAPDLPQVFGDHTRIEQVFFNLVSNAIKFNDKSSVRVEVGVVERSDDFVQFMVRDNGIGIEPEYFAKIFKIFERLNPREEYEGTGAGLTIVKKIIEHHGGTVWLESDLGVGTTFYFTLPAVKEPS